MDWLFGGQKNKVMIKDNSKLMLDLCTKRAESIGHAEYVRTNGKVSLVDIYRTDMLNFLVYLAYADGRMDDLEVMYIKKLLNINVDRYKLAHYAEHWNLMDNSILDNAPVSLEPFVKSNNGPETGEISSQYYDLISLYVTAFNYIGNDFIACNEEIKNGEVEALSSYIMMLRENIARIEVRMEDALPTIEFKPGSKVYDTEEDSEYKKIELDEEYYLNQIYNRNSIDDQHEIPMYENDSHKRTEGTPIKHYSPSRDLKEEKQYNAFEPYERSYNNYNGHHSESESDDSRRKESTYNSDSKAEEAQAQAMNQTAIDEMDIDKLLQNLNDLIGMDSVKKDVNNLVNLLKICQIRKRKGMQVPPTNNHLVFLGNPGTGKTTVARILSQIYHGLGILSKGHLVEVDRSGLVAGYMGQTSEKVMEVVEKAKGGVLFIDEAYALSSGKQDGDFGKEAIDILNKAMEDNREDLIVIAAGYHDEMQDFLDANPGLRSRFNRTIEFPNYTADELIEIISARAEKLDYKIADDALEYVRDLFERTLAYPPDNFGNARSARNYLDNVISKQANRLIKEECYDEEELMLLKTADVESVELR